MQHDIKVNLSDGDHIITWINGTQEEVVRYYLNQEPQDYDLRHPEKTRFPTRVEFTETGKAFAKCQKCRKIMDEVEMTDGKCKATCQ